MDSNSIQDENENFVKARLRLAQELLEDSDALPNIEGYNFKSECEWWRHPRHEREALVNYLLLTCFDRLGQQRNFISIKDWLKSKKPTHTDEREKALKHLKPETPHLESALAFVELYQTLYGVRNAFYYGIESLPTNLQEQLLNSITIEFDPIYGTVGPNTSTGGHPLDDKAQERDLKLKYLYEKRNRFTHRLEQYFAASTPLGSTTNNGASWKAIIKNSQLFYLTANQEVFPLPTGGAHIYSTTWPFSLFEILHAAVKSTFHRTEIKLRFEINLYPKGDDHTIVSAIVDHAHMKDIQNLESSLLKTPREC